jgi:small conductance mechanosensitive channel
MDLITRFFQDITEELKGYYDAFVVITPRLLVALAVLLLVWFLARSIRHISDRRLKTKLEDPLLAEFLAMMIRSVIIIIGLLASLRILGLGGITASILAGAGITAFIIGFALRDIGENFLAGILLAFKRPFKVGDFVESGAIKGNVMGLNIRDTQLKTTDGKDVFVPNAIIIKNPLINYTIDGFLRFDIPVTLPAGSDYMKMIRRIRTAMETVDGVIKKRRKVTVYVSAIAPGKVDLTASFWIDTFTARSTSDHIRSQVFLKIQEVLDNKDEESLA